MDASTQRLGVRLREAREAAQLPLEVVATAADVPRDRLLGAEQGTPIAGHELARVAEVLGLSDVELAAEAPLPRTAVGVLLRGDEGRLGLAPHLGRFAAVARDMDELESALGVASRGIVAGFTPAAAPQTLPFEQGEWLANELRKRLDLGTAPIRSMSDLVGHMGIRLLWTEALDEDVHGLALYDPRRGSSVVVNLRGRQSAWWTVRSTIAHELCHVLFDRVPAEPLGVVSRAGDRQSTEQRANAFSVYFLAPREGVARFLVERGRQPLDVDQYDVHALMTHFALGKEATTWHLKNLGWIDEETRLKLLHASYPVEPSADVESPSQRPPLDRWLKVGVPLERIELVEPALAAYHREKITLGRFREVLDLDPFSNVTQLVA
jgi:Zn-dependent peptidase ImmA (M78 family)